MPDAPQARRARLPLRWQPAKAAGRISRAAGSKSAIGSRSQTRDILNSLGNPAAILVISGEQDGYMEPCGCSEDQEGGLIRRYDLIERLHKRNWPTVLFDLGSLIKDPAGARGGIRAGEDQV